MIEKNVSSMYNLYILIDENKGALMKRTLSLILAALLLSSVLTACGESGKKEPEQGTAAVETSSPETKSPENDPQTPLYNPLLITENGIAKAHIVLAENADQLERYAAEELVLHIKKVTGADITVVNFASADSLPIILGTPDSVPALAELFPEDIAWLTTLEEGRTNYADDGFAIRTHEGKLYIFGITPAGALNGVHDFIEENTGVLWIRADENMGLIYEDQPTITVAKTNYREKSPLRVRGWVSGGRRDGIDIRPTEVMYNRNKENTSNTCIGLEHYWEEQNSVGMSPLMINHYLQHWVLNSPIYDPNCTEYWNTDKDGNPYPLYPSQTNDITKYAQINFWSEKTLNTVIEGVLAYLRATPTDNVTVGVEDNELCTQLPYSQQPFEYEPGQFVEPSDDNYISTVFFTFINKIARAIKEEFPDVTLNTYAYWLVEAVPECEIEDNIRIIFAPILEDMTEPLCDENSEKNKTYFNRLKGWTEKTDKIVIYNYYGCFYASSEYERPIWERMQTDMQWYAENGIEGVMSEGSLDINSSNWTMNTFTYWLYSKLAWNPYEDIDALIVEFCNKVYGEASEPMQEYYRLIRQGWEEGDGSAYLWNFKLTKEYYFDTFVYLVDLEDDIVDALNRAYDAADDKAKALILPIKNSYEAYFAE